MTSKAIQTRRMNYHYMADAMRKLEWDLHQTILGGLRIPEDWHRIAREKPCAKKTRVTLRLDADLVTFFRSMGPDWQVRVNHLMSVWMHARLAGLIDGPETMDYLKRSMDDPMDFDGPRPDWADGPRGMEADGLSPEFAWGQDDPEDIGVPLGRESTDAARQKEAFRIRLEQGRARRREEERR